MLFPVKSEFITLTKLHITNADGLQITKHSSTRLLQKHSNKLQKTQIIQNGGAMIMAQKTYKFGESEPTKPFTAQIWNFTKCRNCTDKQAQSSFALRFYFLIYNVPTNIHPTTPCLAAIIYFFEYFPLFHSNGSYSPFPDRRTK